MVFCAILFSPLPAWADSLSKGRAAEQAGDYRTAIIHFTAALKRTGVEFHGEDGKQVPALNGQFDSLSQVHRARVFRPDHERRVEL